MADEKETPTTEAGEAAAPDVSEDAPTEDTGAEADDVAKTPSADDDVSSEEGGEPPAEKEEEVGEEVPDTTDDTEEASEAVEEEAAEDQSPELPAFRVGDTVNVHYKVIEGSKSRVQPYEGLVIAMKGAGNARTFTVRRIAKGGLGVERIFPLYSPNIDKLEVTKRGNVRSSKLYYLRERVGKGALKVREQREQ